jgi:lysophospholipase L1-like esterase
VFRVHPLLVVTSLLVSASAGSAAVSSTNSTANNPLGRFEGEVRKYELIDRRTPPPPHPVLFTGSSSVRLWTNLVSDFPNRPVLNRGFGGSEMSDLVAYFDRLVLPYHPALVVVYEGDNDLAAGKPVDEVYTEFLKFLQRVRIALPGTPVALMAAKPSPSRQQWMANQRDLNARLEALARSSPGVFFIDTFHPLLDATGVPIPEYYQDDKLHLTPAGYAVWQRVVETALNRTLPTGTPR